MNNKNIILFHAVFLLLLLSITVNCIASDLKQDGNIPLTLQQLISKTARYNIKIIDWRNLKDPGVYKIDLKKINNQHLWVEYLKKQFPSCWAITHEGKKKAIYLFPPGVEAQRIGVAKDFASKVDIEILISSLKKAKKIKNSAILRLPEIIALQTLSELEKNRDIRYQRLVNPLQMSSAYSFNVKYNDQFKTLVPYLKNGQPVKGRMEGFSSFSSFYSFIENYSKDLQASRFDHWLFLQLKDDKESVMMISGTVDALQIASRKKSSGTLLLDVYLSGDQNEFKSVGKIYSSKGVVTFVDIATMHW